MITSIRDGKLVIELPLQKPVPSSKGKTLVVGTTNGFQTLPHEIDGKPIRLSINAIIAR